MIHDNPVPYLYNLFMTHETSNGSDGEGLTEPQV
jgi:hypothetical protein